MNFAELFGSVVRRRGQVGLAHGAIVARSRQASLVGSLSYRRQYDTICTKYMDEQHGESKEHHIDATLRPEDPEVAKHLELLRELDGSVAAEFVTSTHENTHGSEVAARVAEYVDQALLDMPKYDVDKAREIYTAMATSPDARLRERAASYVPYFPRYDKEVGYELLERLAADSSFMVREKIRDALSTGILFAADGVDESNFESLDGMGLTPLEASQLLLAFIEASR